MIHVERGPAPLGFAGRAAGWRQLFAKRRLADPRLSAAAFWSSIRDEISGDGEVLKLRFHTKCGFCESKGEHSAALHIEHYRPKSRKPFEPLIFDWSNWLVACARCNQKKWAHFPTSRGQPQLLNPADPADNPAGHICFQQAAVFGTSERGHATIRLLGLDRTPLNDQRARWIGYINILLLLVVSAATPQVKTEARNLLIWAMQVDAPYSAMVTSYLSTKAPKLAAPAIPHARLSEAGQMDRLRWLAEEHASSIADLVV